MTWWGRHWLSLGWSHGGQEHRGVNQDARVAGIFLESPLVKRRAQSRALQRPTFRGGDRWREGS